ncbi:hypothetical protein D3C73_763480 [compost metagenome]
MHGTALVQRRGGNRYTGLFDGAAGKSDIALARLDQTAAANAAGRAVGDEARRDLIAPRGRSRVLRRTHAAADHEAVAGRQLGLALARLDLARVLHTVAGQQHIAAATRCAGGFMCGDARATFNHDLAHRIGEGRRIRVGAVQAVVTELRVADPRCGGGQVADVDLAVVAEHHAVAVGNEHRAVGLQLAQDLAGPCVGVVDPVQHRPVGVLQEIEGGVATDVEGFPVQDRLVSGLLDADLHPSVGALRLDRFAGIDPATGQRIPVHLQAILAQPIGHHEARLASRLPGLLLHALLQCDGLRGRAEVVDRLLQFLSRRILLLCRQLELDRHAIGHAATLRCRALGGAAVGEPAGAERLLRLAGRSNHGAQRHGHGPGHRVAAPQGGGETGSGRMRVRHRGPRQPDGPRWRRRVRRGPALRTPCT